MRITYSPKEHLVETKSLKLWLWRYRDIKQFNEMIVAELAYAFFEQVSPYRVIVEGRFHQRGGIAVTARAEHRAAPSGFTVTRHEVKA